MFYKYSIQLPPTVCLIIFIYSLVYSLPWHETFVVVQDLDSDFQAHDDFQRENAFYDSTLKGVSDAIRKLKQEKIPIDRPVRAKFTMRACFLL